MNTGTRTGAGVVRGLTSFGFHNKSVDVFSVVTCSPRWWFGADTNLVTPYPDIDPKDTCLSTSAGISVMPWRNVDDGVRMLALEDMYPNVHKGGRREGESSQAQVLDIAGGGDADSSANQDYQQRLGMFLAEHGRETPEYICIDGRTVLTRHLYEAKNRRNDDEAGLHRPYKIKMNMAWASQNVWAPGQLTRAEVKCIAFELQTVKSSQRAAGIMDILDYGGHAQKKLVAAHLGAGKTIKKGRGAQKMFIKGRKAQKYHHEAHEALKNQFLASETLGKLTATSDNCTTVALAATEPSKSELWNKAQSGEPLLQTLPHNVLGAPDSHLRVSAAEVLKQHLAVTKQNQGMTQMAPGNDEELMAKAHTYLRVLENLHDLPLTQVMLKVLDMKAPGILPDDWIGRNTGLILNSRSDVGCALFLQWYYQSWEKNGKAPAATETEFRNALAKHVKMMETVESKFVRRPGTSRDAAGAGTVAVWKSVDLLNEWAVVLDGETLKDKSKMTLDDTGGPGLRSILPPGFSKSERESDSGSEDAPLVAPNTSRAGRGKKGGGRGGRGGGPVGVARKGGVKKPTTTAKGAKGSQSEAPAPSPSRQSARLSRKRQQGLGYWKSADVGTESETESRTGGKGGDEGEVGVASDPEVVINLDDDDDDDDEAVNDSVEGRGAVDGTPEGGSSGGGFLTREQERLRLEAERGPGVHGPGVGGAHGPSGWGFDTNQIAGMVAPGVPYTSRKGITGSGTGPVPSTVFPGGATLPGVRVTYPPGPEHAGKRMRDATDAHSSSPERDPKKSRDAEADPSTCDDNTPGIQLPGHAASKAQQKGSGQRPPSPSHGLPPKKSYQAPNAPQPDNERAAESNAGSTSGTAALDADRAMPSEAGVPAEDPVKGDVEHPADGEGGGGNVDLS